MTIGSGALLISIDAERRVHLRQGAVEVVITGDEWTATADEIDLLLRQHDERERP